MVLIIMTVAVFVVVTPIAWTVAGIFIWVERKRAGL